MKKFVLVTSIVVLAVVMATVFMACTPSVESLEKKYEDLATISLKASDLGLEEADVEYIFAAGSLLQGKGIIVVAFKNGDAAKAYKEDFKDTSYGKLFAENMKTKGNAVAFGDEESIKKF